MVVHKLSKVFQPRIITPPGKTRLNEGTSVSQKLLLDLGLIRSNNTGTSVLLPLAMRSLEKLKSIIKRELACIGGQEISLPSLTSLQLLEKTQRDKIPELFKLKDRHGKELVLSPTHEESIVSLMATVAPSYKQLPLSLYQITSKFRDEMKPKFGLIRSREFLMKDLYCFTANVDDSKKRYKDVNVCYENIFRRLEVPFVCVEGCTGEIGGTLSHEFQIISDIGEDKLLICDDCGHGENENRVESQSRCSNCDGSKFTQKLGIEVGHSFLLGTRYSNPLNGHYVAKDNSLQNFEMSCHGIGISRLLAAAVESLSTASDVRWPALIAPFTVCIIPPKAGSKEEKTEISSMELANEMSQIYEDDIVVDDRTELTIGKRLMDAKRIGYPYVVVVGKSAVGSNPTLELINNMAGSSTNVPPSDLSNLVRRVI